MGVFVDLLAQLERDIETVHGRPFRVTWDFWPGDPPATQWTCKLFDGHVLHEAHRGPNGETPLRRLAEDYAARAHLVREKKANARG